MKPELLEYCQNNIHTVTEFHRHLLPDYAEEINKIFLEYINKQALQASDRSQYHAVCDIIKEYAKVCGKTRVAEIISELKTQYVKRPAFVDELKKIKL